MFKYINCIGLTLILFLNVQPAFSEIPNCEVINYSSNFEVKDAKLVATDSFVIQINNRNGERYTNITIPYSKNQKISDLNAWIEDATGLIVRKLKNSDITDRSAISDFSLYEDDFVKTFSLKHNTYPYRIVYTYKTTSKQFISIHWDPVFHSSVPTRKAKLTLVIPKDYPINKYCSNIPDPEKDTIGNTVRYVWLATYPKPIRNEIFSVSMDKVLPYVIITPLNFTYGVEGSAKDWASFGYWQYRLIKDLGSLPDDEKMKVSQLIKGITSKKEIVKILYHYLQDHTRYVNVTMDIGGLKPYPASYVAQNKYGDCKALSNYMKALLNVADIHSFYTTIYRDEEPCEIIRQVPGPQYFNHVILTVPLDYDTIWLENTSNSTPFAYVGTDIQGREALLIDELNSRLIKMPVLKKSDVVTNRKINITLTSTGHASVDIKMSFKGHEFEYFNLLKTDLNKDEQDQFIRKMVNAGNFDLISWELQRPHRDTARIDLLLKLTFYNSLKSIGSESYFSLIPINVPDFTVPKERTLPVELPIPIYSQDSLTYQLPEGFEVKFTPENQKISTTYGNYELTFKPIGSSLKITKRFELYPGNYLLTQYADFYKFIESVNILERTKIVIKKKT